MKLIKVTVDSYKTIVKPQDLLVDSKATILVGANESGKTNLLEAIELFSLKKELTKSDISKCNRERCSRKQLPVTFFSFSLDKNERKIIASIVPDLSDEETITIKRSGNGIGTYSIFVQNEKLRPMLESKLNELIREKNVLLKDIQKLDKIVKTDSEMIKSRQTLFKNSQEFKRLERKLSSTQRELNKKRDGRNAVDVAIGNLNRQLSVPNLNSLDVDGTSMLNLLHQFPSVHYYKDFKLLPESISIANIKEQKSIDAQLIGNLLKFGKISLQDLDDDYRNLKPIFKAASEIISSKFKEFWSQETMIEIELEKQGEELAISINGGISKSSSPYERSDGFQWLLAFFSHFILNSELDRENKIILIDEPANLLHPRGKKDVLQMLEQLTKENQIIYSTHSPFMINKNFPQRVRLLTKDPKTGTKINNKPYSDGKTNRFWEPLRTSLGVCLGDLLSLGHVNLIVEGISDQLILANMSNIFAELEKDFIDLEKVSLVAAMGANSEEALARLAESEGLDVYCLFDNDSQGNKIKRKLENMENIQLISVNDIKENAITIEDLFVEEEYVTAFNSFYSDYDGFVEYSIDAEDNSSGIIKKLAKHLKEIPDIQLDKVGIAKLLIKNLNITQDNISLYECFGKLFAIINGNETEN